MATGALIGGAVLKGVGARKQQKATKQAAKYQKQSADKYYDATLGAIERGREADEKRRASEDIADRALGKANESMRDLTQDFAERSYGNFAKSSAAWGAANREARGLAMANIALGARERAEKIKRQERANDINEGRANTRSQASGFGEGSSLGAWVDTMVATNEADIQWWQEAGASRDALAAADANLRFKMGEAERAAAGRTAALGYDMAMGESEARYDFQESQREADAVMREASYMQRESDRQYALDRAGADRDAAYSGSKTMRKQADAGLIGAIGGIIGGSAGGIANSYNKFGWGWS